MILWWLAPELFSPYGNSEIPKIIFIAFISTFLVPSLSIYIFKVTHSISSLELEMREERPLPFIFIGIIYGLACYLFAFRLGLSGFTITTMILVTALIIICTFITYFYKISIHSAAMGGAFGLFWVLHFELDSIELVYTAVATTFFSGLVMTSRLALKAHDERQVWIGFVTGVFVVVTGYFLIK